MSYASFMRNSYIRKPGTVTRNVESSHLAKGTACAASTDAAAPATPASRHSHLPNAHLNPLNTMNSRTLLGGSPSKSICALALGLAFTTAAYAAELSLQWDKNPESDVTGYRLYRGTLSGVYDRSADIGQKTTTTALDLLPGNTYYFALTAYDAEGFESNPSEEVVFSVPLSNLARQGNTAPSVEHLAPQGAEDQPMSITLKALDPESDPINFVVTSFPKYGILRGTPPNLTYIPAPNFNGSDEFTYEANDGNLKSSVAKVMIQVASIDDAPVTQPFAVVVNEDEPHIVRLEARDPEGDELRYTILVPPAFGTLSGTGAELVYTPMPNYFGPDRFVYIAADHELSSAEATVSIQVLPIADAPVARNADIAVTEDKPQSFRLSGASLDGLPITYTIVAGPTRGTLSGKGNELVYTPEPNFNGEDQLIFQVNDGRSSSEQAVVRFLVSPENDAPTSIAKQITVDEDGTIEFVLEAADLDDDTLGFAITQMPKQGTLVGEGANWKYTPNANFTGKDSFVFVASDGSTSSAATVVDIVVKPSNDAPIALNQSATVDEDSKVRVTLRGTDAEGSRLTFRIAKNPSNGVLVGTAPMVTYVPNKDFNGTDSFTFVTDDGELTSTEGTVSITVDPANDAPIALDQTVQGNEDTTFAVTLTGSDVDQDTLNYTLLTTGTRGKVSGTPPNLFYTPNPDFTGVDAISFTVTDGERTSSTARITINVLPVNDAPVATPRSLTVDEDTPATIVLAGSDVDGDTVSFRIGNLPKQGKLEGVPPNVRYLPNRDFNGTDTFTFLTLDPSGASSSATVTIGVLAVNDRPEAKPLKAIAPEDGSVAIRLEGSDVDSSELTFKVVTEPLNGKLTGKAPNLIYTPTLHYHGPDSFSYIAYDGAISSSPVTVSITVSSINDAPKAVSEVIPVVEDTRTAVVLKGTDSEKDVLTYTIVRQPTRGTLSGVAPNLFYTPSTNANGADSLVYTVSDGKLVSDPATITINISAVNDAPVASASPVTTNEDTAAPVVLKATDVDGDRLVYTITKRPAKGTLTGTAPNLIYTPVTNYFGADSLTFTVTDGKLTTSPITVNITVRPVNDVPVAANQNVSTTEDTNRAVVLAGTDVEGSKLTYTIQTKPTRGTLVGTAPNLTYVPNANANGSDFFTFIVSDGSANSAAGRVNITITPVNDAPVATAQTKSVNAGGKLNLVLAGTDVDQNTLRYTVLSRPARGTLTGNAPNLTYTAPLNYAGTETFTFSVTDGSLTSAPTTVSITVTSTGTRSEKQLATAASVPNATANSLIVMPGTSTTVLANGESSLGVDPAAESVLVTTLPTHGTVTLSKDGSFEYTHDGSAYTTDSFVYLSESSDGAGRPTRVAVSIFRILDVSTVDAEVRVEFSALAGATYDVESSVTPNDPTSFASITGRFVADGPVVRVFDTELLPNAAYRVLCHTSTGVLTSEIVTVGGYVLTPDAVTATEESPAVGRDIIAEDGTR